MPAVQPATKRPKRVLATEEEVQQWAKESRTAEKGKGREGDEGARPAGGAEAARADHPKDGSRPSASVPAFAAHVASRPRVPDPAKLPRPPPPAHRLSSLLASPAAAAARPASPASAASPAARFTQLLVPARPSTPITPVRETKGILARAPPAQAVPAAESDGEEEGRDEWSPRKKKGGFLLAGLAARASAALAAARTAQTLWLHDMCRALSAAEGARTREELAAELGPAVRVLVLEVLAWERAAGEPAAGGRDRRRERRTVLARCRLLLPPSAGPPTDAEDDPPAAERDTTGLVLFSLHERPSSSSSSSAVPAPSPTKRTGPATSPAGLFVPTTAHDLRFVRPGAELWAWEPVREVVLSARAEDWRVAPPAARTHEVEEENEEVRVGWMLGAEEERERRERAQRERDGDRVTRALVCGRFAVVI
ncbi:hypothetical protein JCM10450v2_007388 [Rhodotorula kratochvilovae]